MMDQPESHTNEETAIPAGENQTPRQAATGLASPLMLFLLTFGAVVGSEIIIDSFLERFQPFPGIPVAVADSTISALIAFLVLYFVVFRNLRYHVTLLEQKEVRLKQSEADYRAIVQDQTELICKIGTDGKITFMNEAFSRFFQRSSDELLGRGFGSLFSEIDAGEITRLFSGLNSRQPIGNTECRVELPDGTVRWSSWSVRAIYSAKGEIIHHQAVGRDITELKNILRELHDSHDDLELKVQQRTQEMATVNRELRTEIATRRAAEAALQASETNLKLVIDQLPAVLWTVDRSLSLTSLLGSHMSVFQQRMESLLQSAPQEGDWADEQVRLVSEAHKKALLGESADFELSLEDHNFHCTVEPFHNTDGEIIGCLGIAVDITVRKQAEDIIRRQHTALEAAADGIIITDEKGTIQWANPAMTAITGYARGEMVGSTPAIFRSDYHPKDFFAGLWKTILSGQIWRGETYNRRKDGGIYVEDQTITPVLDPAGKIQNFIAIKHDITDRKKAEEEITRRNQELLALGEASILLTRSLEPQVVIQAFLDLMEKLIHKFDRFTVLILEDECLQLAGIRTKNRSGDIGQPALLEVSHFPLFQAVLNTKKSYLLEDCWTSPLWKPFLNGSDTHCWLGVPMQTGERVIGVCCLESNTSCTYNDEIISLVEALVGHAAVAIQNSRLYHEVRESRERLQAMSRRLVDVQESERRYIARELHDDTSQALIGLVFALEVLKRDAGDEQAVAASVAELDRVIGDILDNLHRLAVNLRPAALDHLGLVPAIRQYVDGLQDKYHLKINLTLPQLPERLSIDCETMLYRIVQEALANIVLHADARNAELRMELLPGKIRALISDDGIGFNLDEALAQERLGLFGMRERAEMLGGALAIDSAPGAGTRISLEVPFAFSDPDRG